MKKIKFKGWSRTIKPINAIKIERFAQEIKWGKQDHDFKKWLTILVEEVGEIAKEINELHPTADKRKYAQKKCIDNTDRELVQTAAICVAWLEHIDRIKKHEKIIEELKQ